jgi:hypothetical protein
MFWLIRHLDPDWRVAHRLLSIQVAVFWAVVSGLWVAIPAFQSYLSPTHFAELCIGFALLIMIARLTNQPGVV